MIDDEEFAEELARDQRVEVTMFWKGLAALAIVITVMVLRQLYFV